jgi:hypothetical protein
MYPRDDELFDFVDDCQYRNRADSMRPRIGCITRIVENNGICGVNSDFVEDHWTSNASFHFNSWPESVKRQSKVVPVSINKTMLAHVTRTTKSAKRVATAFDMNAAALVRRFHRLGALRT